MFISIPWWIALLAVIAIAALALAVAFFAECDDRGVRPRTRIRHEVRVALEKIGDRCYDLSDRF